MSFSLGMSKLSGIIGDIISAIFKPLGDFVLGFILKTLAIIPQLLYMVFACIAQIVDVVQILFRLLAGMSDSMVYLNSDVMGHINGKPTGNFILDILMSRVVMSVFSKMLVVAVILLVVFTFVAIIKNEYSSEGAQNSKGKIVGKSLKALFTFLFIPVICLAGIMISNGLLNTLDGASSNGAGSKISARIFVAAAYNANRVRMSGKVSDVNMMGYTGISYGQDDEVVVEGEEETPPKRDKEWMKAAELVDEWFGNGMTVKPKDGADNKAPIGDYTLWGALGSIESGANSDGSRTFTILDTGAVFHYYDLWSFNYILGFVAIAFITLTFVSLLLGLAKRAIDLAILFVISPPIVAVMPLDNGQMFGKWKTEFVKRVLNTYAPVIAMNLYLVLIPHFMNVDIFTSVVNSYVGAEGVVLPALALLAEGGGNVAAQMASGVMAVMVNSIFQIVMILAGAVAVKSSIDWISDLIGAENLAKTSKEMNDGTVAMGTKAAAIGLRGAQVVGAGVVAGAKLTGAVVGGAAKGVGGLAKHIKDGKDFKKANAEGKTLAAWRSEQAQKKESDKQAKLKAKEDKKLKAYADKHGLKDKGWYKATAQAKKAMAQEEEQKYMKRHGGKTRAQVEADKKQKAEQKEQARLKRDTEYQAAHGHKRGEAFKKGAAEFFGQVGGAFGGLGGAMGKFTGTIGASTPFFKDTAEKFMGVYDKKGLKAQQSYKELEARKTAEKKLEAKDAKLKAKEIEASNLKVDKVLGSAAQAEKSSAAADADQNSKYLQEVAAGIKRLTENGIGKGTQYGEGLARIKAAIEGDVKIQVKADLKNIINDDKIMKAVDKEIKKQMNKK